MYIITDNTKLTGLVPNVTITVEGEQTLFDKVKPWLITAEEWVMSQFTSQAVLQSIGLNATTIIWHQVAGVIVAEALRNAIPSLDLVLTPNGYGIVSTQDVAPASKERVERLVGSMLARRDNLIDLMIEELKEVEAWHSTPQKQWLVQTLMQSPRAVVFGVCGNAFDGDRWTKFLEIRDKAVDIEADIAERWVSTAVMERLRLAMCDEQGDDEVNLSWRLRQIVMDEIAGGKRSLHRLERIVQYLRTRLEQYPEWLQSDTAKLFTPEVFRNARESKGYFF